MTEDSLSEHVRHVHRIAPVFESDSRALVLGTFPSPRSREANFFYMHPQNRFWPILAALFDEELPPREEDARRAFALAHHIALWDVLAQCDIIGASDASIRNPVANDLTPLLQVAPQLKIFTTGNTATRLYRQLIEPKLGVPSTALPSPSPANARMNLAQLVEAYQPLKDAVQ